MRIKAGILNLITAVITAGRLRATRCLKPDVPGLYFAGAGSSIIHSTIIHDFDLSIFYRDGSMIILQFYFMKKDIKCAGQHGSYLRKAGNIHPSCISMHVFDKINIRIRYSMAESCLLQPGIQGLVQDKST